MARSRITAESAFEAGSAPGNLPEWTVSELSAALKRTVEDAYGFVRVRGEVSGFRGAAPSGHVYFRLKDDRAVLEAVIWKGVYGRMRVKPEEGLDVVASGKLTTFAGSSKYQIVIDTLEPAGVGALMKLLEERKKKLAAEGLFDEVRKQLLPFLPEVIGVVTSPTGAVIRDILHRLQDRFPRRVLVWPVRVQGETSATEVAAAIEGFNALPEKGPLPRPDLIIVARGGGSLDASVYGEDRDFLAQAAVELGASNGRILAVDPSIADVHTGHGIVMPPCHHGGPGRAGNGAELGGLYGLRFYQQRVAVQGSTDLLAALQAQTAAEH